MALSAIWRQWRSGEVRDNEDVRIINLFEAGSRDVELQADCFVPMVQKGSKGIRALVHG